jgi:hypothetical protein
VIFVVDEVAMEQDFFKVFRFFPAYHNLTTAPHTYMSQPHEVCASPDEAAHCHTLGHKLGGFISDQPLCSFQGKGRS